MAQIKRKGYGQVEPNQISGIITGQILDQLPADKDVLGTILEQGRFAKYDYNEGKVNLAGDGKWMMIYNEEHFYDERDGYHKDYAMKAEDFVDGVMVPRLIMPLVGDIMTTNTFGANTGTKNTEVNGLTIVKTDKIGVNASTGYLTNSDYDEDGPVYEVVKIYTLPDGQPAVKLHCIQA